MHYIPGYGVLMFQAVVDDPEMWGKMLAGQPRFQVDLQPRWRLRLLVGRNETVGFSVREGDCCH